MLIGDTLGFLLGRWDLSRSYTDHRSGTRGSFGGAGGRGDDGTGGDAAAWRERGTKRQASCGSALTEGPAQRGLEYARQADGTLMLYRAGGEPFVELDLTSGAWHASHLCGEDHYEISTVVESPDVVQEYWRVTGPAKDHSAVTTLRRRALPHLLTTVAVVVTNLCIIQALRKLVTACSWQSPKAERTQRNEHSRDGDHEARRTGGGGGGGHRWSRR